MPRVGYRFAGSAAGNTPAAREAGKPEARIGIAVLPFVNLSSDPEQAYFADGLAEDLITDLSKVPGLTVIARNSSFRYRNNRADVQSIAGRPGRGVPHRWQRAPCGVARPDQRAVDRRGGQQPPVG